MSRKTSKEKKKGKVREIIRKKKASFKKLKSCLK